MGQADDLGQRNRDDAEDSPARKAARRLHEQGSGERSDNEEQDRQRRERGGAERALRGLVAGLGGVPAHERHEHAIGDDAIGVDEARDHGEDGGQELRVASLGARRAINGKSFASGGTRRQRRL